MPTKKIAKYFFLSRIVFLLFALLAALFVPPRDGYLGSQVAPAGTSYLAWIWANFDGRHFIQIATEGYQKFNFAYFPLYPLLIALLGHLIHVPHIYLAIFISLISLLAAMFVIYKIALIDLDQDTALLSVFLLSVFPLAFFYQSVYSDSLFLLLSATSFYFARKSRWLLAASFCGLTTAARLSGIALVVALAVEWYLQNDKKLVHLNKLTVTLALGASGLIGYMAYLWRFFGDPLLFQKAMSAWKQAGWVLPPQVVFRYLKIFYFVDKTALVFWVAVLEFISLFLYLFLTIYVWRKIRASYGVFMFILLVLVAFTGTFAGTPRYILHLFPAFIGLAIFLKDKPHLKKATILFFLLVGFVLTSLFTRGYFVS